ncbi:MAG: MarR family winged helix-turn-helix transcriptional regulator [Polaromonas sp.]|uniref:MarR family winged helix-turn-helix transcriptional regulator n=1 Tax=Polaromonas sp. TaxID=1869339 RepID=UPI0027356139|nr:MarR family winged helix-turn-helix transcriptional regulator [Polaromonas sp.]MDP2818665.1 MarR family winged helix-turn-helix transcriptional regulator [Polaromonas sp.]
MGELSNALGMDRTTVVAALKPLTGRGLVNVGVDAADRRARSIVLSDKDRLALQEALPRWESAQAGLLAATAVGLTSRGVPMVSFQRLRKANMATPQASR